MSIANRTLTIERTFKAPIELVWEAWTSPQHICQWWGPKGMETRVETHELVVGGKWKYVMQMPDGSDFIAEGQYQEINAPNRLVTSADFKPMTEGVILEVNFETQDSGTKFTFNAIHPSEEYAKQQEAMGFYNGWGSTFDRLEEMLAS